MTDVSGNTYTAQLTKVVDPAQGADQFTTPDSGKRFVGLLFTVTGVSGTASDDINNDVTLTGTNGQIYQADFNSLSDATNFASGDFSVSSGNSESGEVAFQVPEGVNIAKVTYSASDGFDTNSGVAVWNLS